jgi:hypothetical protein
LQQLEKRGAIMAKKRGVDAIDEQANSYSSGGIFAKLENHGDSLICAFVGAIQLGMKGDDAEPCSEEYVWKNNQSEEYDPIKHAGEEPRLRIKWNILVKNPETDEIPEESQIWGGSIQFFRDWKKLVDRKGLGHWFEIERDGKAGSKKTKYRLFDVEKLTAEELEALKKVELRDLEKPIGEDDEEEETPRRTKRSRSKSKAKAKTKTEDSSDSDSSNGVITDKQAQSLREAIKALDNSQAVYLEFKEHFKVSKLTELDASKFGDAGAWIDAVTKAAGKKSDEPEEQDPFA